MNHTWPLIRLEGQRFGLLTVQSYEGIRLGKPTWTCVCDCGRTTHVRGDALRGGKTLGCGCLRGERHGKTNTPVHNVWKAMIARCHRKTHKQYGDYGARGITVCDRWRKSFLAFSADMGNRPPKTTIERIDNSAGYSPGNCKWATYAEQSRNTRRNVWIEHDGRKMVCRDWARELGIDGGTLRRRIKLWGLPRALTEPPHDVWARQQSRQK